MKKQEEISSIDKLKKLYKVEKILGTALLLGAIIISILILKTFFLIIYLIFAIFLYISFLKGIKKTLDKRISTIKDYENTQSCN